MSERLNYLKLDSGSNIYLWLVDQIAIGHPYEYIRHCSRDYFNNELTEFDFKSFEDKNITEINKRKDEIKQAIYDSGLYGKMQSTVALLYEELQSGNLDAKEISSMAATLRGYMETLMKLGSKTEKKETKVQNNFYILKTLEKSNLIEIKDEEKLKFLVDGNA
jgi:hypothetical protein